VGRVGADDGGRQGDAAKRVSVRRGRTARPHHGEGKHVVVSDSRYVWDGTGIVEERDARDNSLLKRFSGAGEEVFDNQGRAAKYFYATDHLGSVREVTDGSDALTAAYDYDPHRKRIR
jgi:hypothetical protein